MKLNKGLHPPNAHASSYHYGDFYRDNDWTVNFKTYPVCSYQTLIHGFRGVVENPNFFLTPDADILLGCSPRKIESVQHYLEAFQLIHRPTLFETSIETETCQFKDNFAPTAFGTLLLDPKTGRDPYLEDPQSNYLLHSHLSASPMALPFYWIFNGFVLLGTDFAKNEAIKSFEVWLTDRTEKIPVTATLRKQINTVLSTYVCDDATDIDEWADRPLMSLYLIESKKVEEVDGKVERFYFAKGDKERYGLSTAVFGYALLKFWDTHLPYQKTLDLKTYVYFPGSPLYIFNLTENQFMAYFEKFQELTDGAIVHRMDTNLNQLYKTKSINALDFLSENL